MLNKTEQENATPPRKHSREPKTDGLDRDSDRSPNGRQTPSSSCESCQPISLLPTEQPGLVLGHLQCTWEGGGEKQGWLK